MQLLKTAILTIIMLAGAPLQAAELHDAVTAGDRAKVQQLLANGADVDAATFWNQSRPLHLADDPEIVKVLLSYEPDVNAASASGTPLQNAAERYARGQKDAAAWREIADLLLEAQAEYDIVSAIELNDLARVQTILQADPQAALGRPGIINSPLRVAARNGREEMCRLLLENHADPNDVERGNGWPILMHAVKYPGIVKQLIDAGADVHQRITWRGAGTGIQLIDQDATVLHYAAAFGVPETITMLLDRGVDPFAAARDIADESAKQTALDVAASLGRANNAEAIVTHAAFKQGALADRQQALDHALYLGAWTTWPDDEEDRLALIQVLLLQHADPNARGYHGPVIQCAASHMHADSAEKKELIRRSVDTLVQHGGRLDLFSAVAIGDEEAVAQLLKQDPTSANARGPEDVPAICFAIEENYERIVALLIDAHCDLNIRDRSVVTDQLSDTPLHYAVKWGRPEIAKRLIEAGADVNAKDENGWTPLEMCPGFFPDRGAEVEKLLLERVQDTRP